MAYILKRNHCTLGEKCIYYGYPEGVVSQYQAPGPVPGPGQDPEPSQVWKFKGRTWSDIIIKHHHLSSIQLYKWRILRILTKGSFQ